jgi:hypothetical protein
MDTLKTRIIIRDLTTTLDTTLLTRTPITTEQTTTQMMRNEMRETYIVGGQIELNGIARNHGYVRSSG